MRKNIIIRESQLDIIREYENKKVLREEFENKIRSYMEQLFSRPTKPKYDDFFDKHDIPEDILQNKMLDLGLIKKKEKISEPTDASGKKHSMYSVQYTFSNENYENKIDELYNFFFKNGERRLTECDAGGASACDGASSCGATNAEGVGGQYTVPFGGIMRRGFGVSGQTVTNIDTKPPLKRNKTKGISVNQA